MKLFIHLTNLFLNRFLPNFLYLIGMRIMTSRPKPIRHYNKSLTKFVFKTIKTGFETIKSFIHFL